MKTKEEIRQENKVGRLKNEVGRLRKELWRDHETELKALPESRKVKIRPLINDDLTAKTESQLRLMVKKLRALDTEMYISTLSESE